jgi:FixJ family two-component response regulator
MSRDAMGVDSQGAGHGPSVWVVDDDPGVTRAVARLLRSAAFEVVALHSLEQLLERLEQGEPECLLLDLWLGDDNALDVLPALQRRAEHVPVVFLSGGADVHSCVEAMKLGAIDFLEKPIEGGTLLDAVIRAVARGSMWREARTTTEAAVRRLASLTRREREVFALVALGNPNKRIAAQLGTTEKTIKVHRGRVMQKLRADSVVDLVHLAQQVGEPRAG